MIKFVYLILILGSISVHAEIGSVSVVPMTNSVEFEELNGSYDGLYIRYNNNNWTGKSNFQVVEEPTEEALAVPCSNQIVRDLRTGQALRRFQSQNLTEIESRQSVVDELHAEFSECLYESSVRNKGADNEGFLMVSDCYEYNLSLEDARDRLEIFRSAFESERANLFQARQETSAELVLCRARHNQNPGSTEGLVLDALE